MDVNEYIKSGILELYVAGVLSESENLEVEKNALAYPEIKKEIQAIEDSILSLSRTISPGVSEKGFDEIRARVGLGGDDSQVIHMSGRKTNWSIYLGWAASVLLAICLFWLYNENSSLKSAIQLTNQENSTLQQQILEARSSFENSQNLLNTLRDKDIVVIPLGGQSVSPSSYAKAYWNKKESKVIIDAQGLPEPPDGMVYQVWSLQLDPLIPTSIGLLDDFKAEDEKIFTLNDPHDTEAFGITLEPAGGSPTPTMDQLYTLGAISPS